MNKTEHKKTAQLKTLMRLMNYLIKDYPWQLVIVLICILITAFATVQGSLFLQVVIDDHVTPLLAASGAPDFSGLLKAVLIMGLIYLLGVLTSITFNQLMVTISQGTQKKIRDELFAHMETLPLAYFDTHSKGDVMSHYTNDINTLYLSTISGEKFTKVATDLEELIDWNLIEASNCLYFRTIEDTNKNGQFDQKDVLHYNYIDLNKNDWKVIRYSPI